MQTSLTKPLRRRHVNSQAAPRANGAMVFGAKSPAAKPAAKVTGKLAAAEKAVVKKVAPACSLHNHQFPPP